MSEFIWYILFGLVIFTIGAYIWTLFNDPTTKNKKLKKNEPNSDEEWRNDPRFK
tara:strand:+ start:314 stop:475 length:162 start_codon:yes stop_codon:yes gene_type:complete